MIQLSILGHETCMMDVKDFIKLPCIGEQITLVLRPYGSVSTVVSHVKVDQIRHQTIEKRLIIQGKVL